MAPEQASPKLWVLSKGRKGDLDQMLALAQALGWPFETKLLSFRAPEIPPLAPLLLRDGTALEPPWPDLVLCAEAMSSVIALKLKQRSGGRIKAVCLGRPAGSTRGFDLVITTAQYRLPAAPNVLELSLPISSTERREDEAYAHEGPRPLTAVIIGGPAFPDRLDAQAAKAMIARLKADAAAKGGSLVVHTSPRTPPDVSSAIARDIAPPHRAHLYAQGSNRYHALLARRTKSSSPAIRCRWWPMRWLRETVSVYPLPQQKTLKWRWASGSAPKPEGRIGSVRAAAARFRFRTHRSGSRQKVAVRTIGARGPHRMVWRRAAAAPARARRAGFGQGVERVRALVM